MNKKRAKRVACPMHHLKKKEMVWLFTHYCKHGHRYIEHYACYLQENPQVQEKIGFLDIEASNLDANWGIILSYCIKDSQSNKIYSGVISKKDITDFPSDKTDKRIVTQLIKDLKLFDRVVAHYGRKFDIPYIRTRALILDIDFPHFGSLYNDDTWVIAKHKLKLNSNRLDTIEASLFGEVTKTRLTSKYWIGGSRGDKKSLRYILDHNKRDVLALEKIWWKLKDYVSKTNCSI